MSLYSFLASVLKLFYKLMFRINIEGIENVTTDGGVIFTPNHKSNFDPPLIACILPVRLTFMAKEELFKMKIIGFILKKCGAFPIKRGGTDISAMKSALKILKDGGNMLIFPEGTRCPENGKILRGKSGAALLAYKSEAKIVPIGIDGSYKFRKKITIRIGKTLDVNSYFTEKPSSADFQSFTDNMIMEQIRLLAGAEFYDN